MKDQLPGGCEECKSVDEITEWEDVPEGLVSEEEQLSWFSAAAWEIDYDDEVEAKDETA